MGNTKSAEKKGIGALNWTLLLVIGFSAQIAWVIDNLGLDTLGNFHHCLRAYALSARQHL